MRFPNQETNPKQIDLTHFSAYPTEHICFNRFKPAHHQTNMGPTTLAPESQSSAVDTTHQEAAYPKTSEAAQPWKAWMKLLPVMPGSERAVCAVKECAYWGTGSS